MNRGRKEKLVSNRFLNNKKGISAVITNLLIILLVLVAVGIVWIVVSNIIKGGTSDIEIERFTLDINIDSAYVSGTDVVVTIRRSVGGGEITGIAFTFSNQTESIIVRKIESLNEGGRRTYTFTTAEIPGIGAGDEVSVSPIYISSGKEKTANPTDTKIIDATPPEGTGGTGGTGSVCGNAVCESDETSVSCPADCTSGGGSVCGNAVCESDETPITCPLDCTSGGGAECGNNICEDTENQFQCPADCSIPSLCDGLWNQEDIDAGLECDGDPQPNKCQINCMCGVGFGPDNSGNCIIDLPLNSGIINSAWNNIFFDSHSLPKNDSVVAYISKYVNFSDSPELGCFRITFADYLEDNDISYLRLNDEPPVGVPNIDALQGYYIWEATNCGQ
ncbi:MAG: hypothetical protein ABH840_01470 [Nanoarchaeota archaeon]